MKSNDNLRQEQFAMQLVMEFNHIFKRDELKLKLTPYEVISMGNESGIIEMIQDCTTFDTLKNKLNRNFPKIKGLGHFFEVFYGEYLHKARNNFARSLAAYSLVCYFLQLKDRHNGNIMLHKSGKIIHIDFGFFLSNYPGKE